MFSRYVPKLLFGFLENAELPGLECARFTRHPLSGEGISGADKVDKVSERKNTQLFCTKTLAATAISGGRTLSSRPSLDRRVCREQWTKIGQPHHP
jgi:hypothetical protein